MSLLSSFSQCRSDRSFEISGREAEAIEIVRRGVPVRGDLANSKETIYHLIISESIYYINNSCNYIYMCICRTCRTCRTAVISDVLVSKIFENIPSDTWFQCQKWTRTVRICPETR